MKSYSESYKKAGVDVTAGYKAVELMKSHIAKTMTAGIPQQSKCCCTCVQRNSSRLYRVFQGNQLCCILSAE